MELFSRSFVRKRAISLATTASVMATSFALADDPTRAYHVRGTRPIQYVADRPDYSSEQSFLSENDAAMNKMMADMTIKPTGDVDRDFVAMMVPHHQGAIDMARAELKYGQKRTASPHGAGNHRHPAAGDRRHASRRRRSVATLGGFTDPARRSACGATRCDASCKF